ncbi:flagellar assembly protein FliW [Metallumcola ferriviriculae]|uniref:Flagellar assembly factor FliW n=1 Tax=Metallumcola ferriviriculae TaxID=3039180 RepID=A0AAU0UQP4_9FIRM|nr:flagellar assembly protein FliW [Desulfitibacteraceae bacterium MK1]
MKVISKRFGELEVDQNAVINFEEGLLGFNSAKQFVLLDVPENPLFKWLQSVDSAEVTFLLVDPFVIKKDYSVKLDDTFLKELEIENKEQVLIYTIVTIPAGGFINATTNLIGPLLINWQRKQGKQIVLEDENLHVRQPLFNPRNKPATSQAAQCGG